MKLIQIVRPEFAAAVAKLRSQDLPGPAAFKLRKVSTALQSEIENFNKTYEEILKRHCDKDETGEPKKEGDDYQFTGENLENVNKELSELGEVEVEIATFKVSELGDKFSLSAVEASALEGFVID